MDSRSFLIGFFVGLLVGLIFWGSTTARADHLTYLPLVPNTPMMQSIAKTQSVTWCVDSAAGSYPSFVTQLRDVYDQYTIRAGIRHIQVGYDDIGCQTKHVMPANLNCVGWAARVYYASWPVTVEYCAQLGYTDWRAAHGHELGHAMLGLHEQYKDSGGVINCTGRQDTVMDCGSGVRYPQPRDLSFGCAVYGTTIWCGRDATSTCQTLGYDPCSNRFRFEDGWSVDASTQVWFNPQSQPEWTPCNQDKLRWSLYLDNKFDGSINGVGGLWFVPSSSFFDPARGYFSFAGGC